MSKLRLPPNPRLSKPPTPLHTLSPVERQQVLTSRRPVLQLRNCLVPGQVRSQDPPSERNHSNEPVRKVYISNRVLHSSKPLAMETWIRPVDPGSQTQRNAEAIDRIATLRSYQSQANIPEAGLKPHRPAEPRPDRAFRRPGPKPNHKTESFEQPKETIHIHNQYALPRFYLNLDRLEYELAREYKERERLQLPDWL